MDNRQNQQEFWVANWRVKPTLTEIEREGTAIQLEPKVMALLEMLASKPGEVFSRQELENTIWLGTIVGYDALSKAVTKLREALGDDKKNPQYIQTISKKGYRLIAEVRREPPPEAAAKKNNVPDFDLGDNKSRLKRQAATGSVIGVFALFVLFYLQTQVDKPGNDTTPTAEKGNTTTPGIKPAPPDNSFSIVVLPFRNISPDEGDAYLADGITSDLITDLSRLSGILVTTANVNMEPDIVKQKLGVRYMLSGDVAKMDQNIRINVRLSDVNKGSILWANRYERNFTDLFAIQDDVTQKIVHSLALTLTTEEKQRIARRYTHSLEAYEYFLRGQYHLSARTAEDSVQALEMYQRAIDIDPGFARAYAGMAIMYTVGYIRQWPFDVDNPLEKALELSSQAIKLDSDLPEAYWVAGFVNGNMGYFEKAIQYLQQTLSLNPNYADAYAMLAWINIYSGKPELAIDDISKAIKLKPTSGYLYKMQLGKAYYFMGDYEQALAQFETAHQSNPAFPDTLFYMAVVYVSLDQYEDAAWIIAEAKNYNPDLDPETWSKRLAIEDEAIRSKLEGDIIKLKKYLASRGNQ